MLSVSVHLWIFERQKVCQETHHKLTAGLKNTHQLFRVRHVTVRYKKTYGLLWDTMLYGRIAASVVITFSDNVVYTMVTTAPAERIDRYLLFPWSACATMHSLAERASELFCVFRLR
eukprot:5258635-Pleurochrysis_carterae.AAC.3